MSKRILIFSLVISIIVNVIFLFSQSGLYVKKEVKWGFRGVDAHGFLEAVNYKAPKDWNTLFYIHFYDNSAVGDQSKFYAREVIISGSSVVNLDLEEYKIIEKTENKVIAKNDTYTFEITKDDVFITDLNEKKSKLSDNFISLK
jgi:hypothetical protein